MSELGINISGYINKQFGLGEGVRSNVRSIATTSVPYVLNDFNLDISKQITDSKTVLDKISTENPYPVNLIQVNIDKLDKLIDITEPTYFRGKYNIAFWAWELENFPEESRKYFKLFDEVWVPSNFCTEAISKISPVPVIKIMHSIEISEPKMSRQDLGLPTDAFIFMTMFDYYSSINRKNPVGAVLCFLEKFMDNDKVLLVIKTSLSDEFPQQKRELMNAIGNAKNIRIIEKILEREELYSLMNGCDCFVSLHRSEGFGLTMAEAMYLGKPVIATGYSANTEFMNLNNSFLVRYKLKSTGNEYYYSTDQDYWADPDLTHAAELMEYVYQHQDKAMEVAKRGMEDVKKNLAPAVLGKKIEKRLKFIEAEMLGRSGRPASDPEVLLLQVEVTNLQKKIEKLKSYKPIKMKIAFKNLKNKITGRDRKYDWE